MKTEGDQISEITKKASALLREGLIDEQQRLLDSGLVKFPNSPELHQQMAISLYGIDSQAAIEHARKCVELAPKDPDKLVICADMLFNLGEKKDAITYVKRALGLIREDSPHIDLLSHLAGKFAKEKGLFKEAEQYLKYAFSENPDMPTWGHELAALYFENGRYDEALSVIDKALKHHPESKSLLGFKLEIIAAIGQN